MTVKDLYEQTLRERGRALLTRPLHRGDEVFRSSGTTGTPTEIFFSRAFHARGSDERRDAFEKFRASTPLLSDYARFRGTTERERSGFRLWPNTNAPTVESDASRQHEYAQFVAEEQIVLPPPAGECSEPAIWITVQAGSASR